MIGKAKAILWQIPKPMALVLERGCGVDAQAWTLGSSDRGKGLLVLGGAVKAPPSNVIPIDPVRN